MQALPSHSSGTPEATAPSSQTGEADDCFDEELDTGEAYELRLDEAWGRQGSSEAPTLEVDLPEGARLRLARRARASSKSLRQICEFLEGATFDE